MARLGASRAAQEHAPVRMETGREQKGGRNSEGAHKQKGKMPQTARRGEYKQTERSSKKQAWKKAKTDRDGDIFMVMHEYKKAETVRVGEVVMAGQYNYSIRGAAKKSWVKKAKTDRDGDVFMIML